MEYNLNRYCWARSAQVKYENMNSNILCEIFFFIYIHFYRNIALDILIKHSIYYICAKIVYIDGRYTHNLGQRFINLKNNNQIKL